jgi:propanol-preferring alcohol dehydrogenase
MKAMLLTKLGPVRRGEDALHLAEIPKPNPKSGEILVKVLACGVCHTELDEIEGRTPPPSLPVVPGHEVVGTVVSAGYGANSHNKGDRVGVGWIYRSSGGSEENLSPEFVATGRDVDGGYAEYMTVGEDYAYSIPDAFSDVQAAPLLCAGGVGYRALHLTGLTNGQVLGLTGFGGSGHLVLQLSKYLYPDSPIYVFARSEREQQFALELGADWAGGTDAAPPGLAHAIIDTTPAWWPVLAAMQNLRSGGRLVINAIRKEDSDRDKMAGIIYERHLWLEKEIKTVANVTSADIRSFLDLAATAGISSEVETYPLDHANEALQDLKEGSIRGAKVLVME